MTPSVCRRDRLIAGRRRAVQLGAIATFAVLTLSVNAAPVSGAPLRQPTTDAADLETPADSGATAEVDRMAAMVAIVNRQGAQNLQRVSAIAVPNLATDPELVVDARAEQVAADAAASAAATAAAEVARSVQATIEAQAAEAAALAATQEAEAEAAAAAIAAAEATARANADEAAALSAKQEAQVRAAEVAALSAKQEAQVRAAEVAATKNADATAALVASEPKLPGRTSSLLIAITPILGGLLGITIWRKQKEPFVLKAKSERPG